MIKYIHIQFLKLYREILVIEFWCQTDVDKVDIILSLMRDVDNKINQLEGNE